MKAAINVFSIICLVALVIVCSLGCNKIAEKAGEAAVEKMIEAESGGDVDVDMGGDKITFTDEDGTTSTTSVGDGVELHKDWPAGLPVYPGGKLELASSTDFEEGVAMTVYITTTDPIEKAAEFYIKKATAMGMKKITMMHHEEVVTGHLQSADWALDMACGVNEDDGNIGITLMLNPGDGTVPEGEGEDIVIEGNEGSMSIETTGDDGTDKVTTAEGDLPDGFPVDIIPVYAGADIESAMCMENNYMLQLYSSDADNLVNKYYNKFFRESGWKLETSVSTDEGYIGGWIKDGQSISLSLAKSDGGTAINLVYMVE